MIGWIEKESKTQLNSPMKHHRILQIFLEKGKLRKKKQRGGMEVEWSRKIEKEKPEYNEDNKRGFKKYARMIGKHI